MYFAAVAIIIFTAMAFILFASGADNNANVEFLQSYGWLVDEKPIDEADVIIPNPFDLVYENYNKLQLEANLDLTPYMGKSGRRYTYKVTNYPKDVGEEVRANVICIDGNPVAGDIMTVSLQGFMHSLNYPTNK
jgi:hypothetical protein